MYITQCMTVVWPINSHYNKTWPDDVKHSGVLIRLPSKEVMAHEGECCLRTNEVTETLLLKTESRTWNKSRNVWALDWRAPLLKQEKTFSSASYNLRRLDDIRRTSGAMWAEEVWNRGSVVGECVADVIRDCYVDLKTVVRANSSSSPSRYKYFACMLTPTITIHPFHD